MALIVWLVGGVPLPYRTVTQGVVWAEESAQVRAGASGFLSAILAAPDSQVTEGAALLRLEDPVAASRVALLEIDRRASAVRYDAVRAIDPVQARMLSEQVALAEYRLEDEKARAAEMEILAPQSGRFVLPGAEALEGRYIRKGAFLGFVTPEGAPVIRAVIPQSQIDLVRSRLAGVELRAASRLDRPVTADIRRAPPATVFDVPAEALTSAAGGPIVAQIAEDGRARAVEPFFIVDIVPTEPMDLGVGERVHVRFDHGREPLLFRLTRDLRRLFLRQFDV